MQCCNDGNFCDFPWCDCEGNAEYRERHGLKKRSDPLPRQEDSRIANHIDGYDRDDLGESPDY